MSISVKGLSFVGVRTASLERMSTLLKSLGYRTIHAEADFLAFEAPDGSRFELFGLLREDHSHFTTGPVVGFEVDDIRAAEAQMKSLGLEALSPIQGREGGTRWIHFRGPDGNVYEFVNHVRKHSGGPPHD